MELLLRTVRPATDALCQVAAELRPDRARLLSRELYGIGSGAIDSGTASFFVHGDRICAFNLSPRYSAEKTGKATESFSADSAPGAPHGESVDVGSGVTRDQSQSAKRFGTAERCSEESWPALVARRGKPASGTRLGEMEPGDVCRHERNAVGRPVLRGIADGHSGARTGDGIPLQSEGAAPDSFFSD